MRRTMGRGWPSHARIGANLRAALEREIDAGRPIPPIARDLIAASATGGLVMSAAAFVELVALGCRLGVDAPLLVESDGRSTVRIAPEFERFCREKGVFEYRHLGQKKLWPPRTIFQLLGTAEGNFFLVLRPWTLALIDRLAREVGYEGPTVVDARPPE